MDLHVAGKGLSSRGSRFGVNLASLGEEDQGKLNLFINMAVVIVVYPEKELYDWATWHSLWCM